MIALEARDVVVEFESRGSSLRAVSGVSIRVNAGESVGIVGDSGSGKSSLLLALLGTARPGGLIASGSIKYDGVEILGARPRVVAEVRRKQVGFITQHPKASFNPLARVGDQIVSVLLRSGQSASKSEAKIAAFELFRSVGMADPGQRLRAYPHELSGGMAQRALIALAMAKKPRVLLADEPTSGLDVTLQAQVLDTIREGAKALGSSLVIVTHDIGVVAEYCDRVYLMSSGEVVEEAAVSSFLTRPRHPAALALLATDEEHDAGKFRLLGLPPDRRHLPQGCYLNRRCAFAATDAGCFDAHPEFEETVGEHRVRCHRHELVAAARDA